MINKSSGRFDLKLEKSTADPFQEKRFNIVQPENGYRYAVDPFILAGHICPTGREKVVDIGCGCGILPVLLSFRHSSLTIYGIEIQETLARFAKKNTADNRFKNSIHIITADINRVTPHHIQGDADIIVSNPPYKKKGSGRLNPNSQKAIARHEIMLDITQVFKAADRLLSDKGSIYLIFPAERLQDLINAMTQHRFHLRMLRFVHTTPGSEAKRFVICATRQKQQPARIRSPFYIYNSGKCFTEEYLSLFSTRCYCGSPHSLK